MKNQLSFAAGNLSLAIAIMSLGLISGASATPVYWRGLNGVSATTNFSDTANWSLQGTTTPSTPANNAANFTGSTAVSGPGLVTVNVDGAYSSPGSGLAQCYGAFFGVTNGYHTVFIQPGITWALQASAGTVGVGISVGPQPTNNNNITTVNTPTTANYTNYTTFTGIGGTFSNNGPGLHVEAACTVPGNHYSILDMSGLGTFMMTNTGGAADSFYVVNGGANSQALVYLALTNVITLNNNFQVGYLGASSNSLPIGVYLGQSNYISTGSGNNTLVVGYTGCTSAFMKFNPALVGGANRPTAFLTGNNGSQNVIIGNVNTGRVPGSATVDFTGGNVTWSINTLSMGVSGTNGIAANATLTFDNGTITANSAAVGVQPTNASGSFGAAAGQGTINIGANATFKATSYIVLGTNLGTLAAGTAGTINIAPGGTLSANTISNGGGAGIINMTNANWDVALSSTTVTNMAVSAFNAAGSTNIIYVTSITPMLPGNPPVRFHLIASANLTGAATLGVVLPASYDPSHPYAGYLDFTTTPGLVDLVLTSAPAPARALTWTGLNGGSPDGDWDVATTSDWQTNGVATVFNQFDLTTFGDVSAPAQTSVNLTTALTPFSVTMNNTASQYTFGGGGSLGGSMGLVKQGTGTLILDNSASNSFTGGVTISGGILQVGTNDANGNLPAGPVADNSVLAFDRTDSVTFGGVISGSGAVVSAGGGTLHLAAVNTFSGPAIATNSSTLQGGAAQAFGASSGVITVANGSTLDPNGAGTTRAITVSGNGVGGNGAIVNSGGTIGDNTGGLTPTLTLAGDTTLAVPSRWDLGSSTGATLSTGGQAYNLTLTSSTGSYFEWRDLRTDTNLAGINIVSGDLGVAGSTTLGNPASTLNVAGYAGLKFYSDDGFNVNVNKQIVINDDGLLQNGSGSNVMYGGLNITNSHGDQYCEFVIGGTSLTVNSTITGNGILYMQGSTSPLILNGNGSAYTGGVLVQGGSLVLNGTLGCGVTDVNSTTVSGTGSMAGPMDVGGSLIAGSSSAAGTLTTAGLILEGGASATFNLTAATTTGQGVNSFIQDNGSVTFNGGNTLYINPLASLPNGSTYTLIACSNYSGTLPVATTVSPSSYSFSVNAVTTSSNTLIQVTVTGGQPSLLVWDNDGNDSQWDVQGSQNWSNTVTHTAQDYFYSFDPVLLDDSIAASAHPSTSISIQSGQAVIPSVLTNNSTTNYTISGPGKISGVASIVKLGTSTLTITATNDFTGTVTIAGGTLKAGPSTSLGAVTGAVYVTNGATLDLDYSLMGKPLVLSGSGVGGQGALVNNDPSGTPVYSSPAGLLNVTLGGNATVGGTNRIDFGQLGATGSTLNSGGHNYSLTILGPTYRQWDNVALDANFGNINVMATNGALGLVGLTTLGNPTNTLAVFPGASLDLYNDNTTLSNMTVNKNVLLYGNTILLNGSGSNLILSPVTLGLAAGDNCTNNIGGSVLTVSNAIGGPGNLIKMGSSPLVLAGVNTYTGSTIVTTGPLVLVGSGSISDSTNISLASGQTLNVSGRTDQTLTLASGQTFQGSGTVSGNLVVGAGSTVAPGFNGAGTLTVTNIVMLQGTTAVGVGAGSNNVLSGASINYGGTLSVSFVPGSLSAGNSFKLFNSASASYAGSFASIVPSTPGAGLSWDTTQLAVSGKLNVTGSSLSSSTFSPIGPASLSGSLLTLSGGGGTPNGTYKVMTTISGLNPNAVTNGGQIYNYLVPLATNWFQTGSGTFDSNGNFSIHITVSNAATQFYLIQQP